MAIVVSNSDSRVAKRKEGRKEGRVIVYIDLSLPSSTSSNLGQPSIRKRGTDGRITANIHSARREIAHFGIKQATRWGEFVRRKWPAWV